MREQISKMIQAAIDGNASCCEVHTKLKELENVIKSGLKVIQGGAVEEAREFDKGGIYFGGKWESRFTATLLDYSQDKEYTELNGAASKRKKDLNAAWKAKNEGRAFFDTEAGEQIPVLPVKTPGHEIVVFKESKPIQKQNDGKTDLAF